MGSGNRTGLLKRFPRLKHILLWSHKNERRGPRYVLTMTLALSCIWLPAIAYIVFASPTYTSKWSLILPGKGAGASVNLTDIGQASTEPDRHRPGIADRFLTLRQSFHQPQGQLQGTGFE